MLNDGMLGQAGLSGLKIATSASVTLLAGADLRVAKGGAVAILAGRNIVLDGNITAPSGSISARTLTMVDNTRQGMLLATSGSPFRSDDDVLQNYADVVELHPFDITVNGRLSAAGLWTNDLKNGVYEGAAFIDGGSITLDVAPNAFVGVGGVTDRPVSAVDFSGSIRIDSAALLDVSSGGYVGLGGLLDLTGKGGDIALINRTFYASTRLTAITPDNNSFARFAIGGLNQSVQFTPYQFEQASITSALVPVNQQAEIDVEAGSLRGFGFSGGGTFTLVAPDIAMGSAAGKGPRIGLDFLQRTGFSTLDLSAYKSRLVSNIFDNGRDGLSAFLEVSRFEVGAGETLDLTQTVLPSLLQPATRSQLTKLETGGDIYTLLTPTIPVDVWDRLAANLKLGGMTELDVAAGATVTGAATASITVPRLYNAGTIRIAGGTIEQVDPLQVLGSVRRVIGVRDEALGGGGLGDVLGGGTPGQTNGFDENALLNADVFSDLAQTDRLTNGELFSTPKLDALLIFTGRVALNEGIHLTSSSTIDLSGTAIYNPRGDILRSGRQLQTGKMIAGGRLETSRVGQRGADSGYSSVIQGGNQLVGEAGAAVRLDGASGAFDQRTSRSGFSSVAQWSDGGTLAIGNGAQLVGVTLSAEGGDDGDADLSRTKAVGGLLDWVAPTLRQDMASADASGASLSANQVMAAGFDTLVARGSMDVAGTVDLRLGKSFIATTAPIDGRPTTDKLVISTQEGAAAAITAPYIRFASSAREIGSLGSASGTGSLAFNASTIDIVGSALFNVTAATSARPGSVTFAASSDVRLIGTAGVPDSTTGLFQPGITGQLISTGDITFSAGQVYATTGTGNLQQLLEDRRAGKAGTPTPYLIASSYADGNVNFTRTSATLPDTPLSAGSYLAVRGAHISQNGVLRAPLGMLDIGSNDTTAIGPASVPATLSLVFGPDSLTSVSARTSLTGTDALAVPYGTTTDLIEYFFSPGTDKVLSTVPSGELRFAGKDISFSSNNGNDVHVDGRGGGDVFAFEFIPGTGGSRDVLDRLNADQYSGNNGLQFPDGRQVYAILPVNSATVAGFDPIYSADYSGGGGVDLYGLNAGMTVKLDAAPGIAAGEYLLLPAHYALLPGAMRIVENVGTDAPYAGAATTLLDGSVIVGGSFGTAGTNLVESARRSFTIQSQEVFSKYSNIQTTSGSGSIAALADRNNLSLPRLPRDAARATLSPLTSLKVAGAFAMDAATDGLGSEVDIGGTKIRIAAPGAQPTSATSDYVLLTTDTLASFNANSLSIGALRNNNADGTTTLDVVTQQMLIDNNVNLSAPELLLAVGGVGSVLSIADAARGQTGAVLTATGTLNNQRTGDYIINATEPRDASVGTIDKTGSGALIRLATGPERLVTRQGDYLARNTLLPARLDIGAGASLGASTITLDSSRTFAIDKTARIGAAVTGGTFDLAVSADQLRLGALTFDAAAEAQFGLARHLTYRSPDIISFAPGNYRYNDLTIDAGGIGYATVTKPSTETSDVNILANHVELGNSFKDVGACLTACSSNASLAIDARDITFFGGMFRTKGFVSGVSDAVVLRATEGMYVTGSGGFSTADKAGVLQLPIRLLTPFIVDRTNRDITRSDYVKPDFTFTSLSSIEVSGTGLAAVTPTGDAAPGARIGFAAGVIQGLEGDVTITDALVRATAGRIDVNAQGSITLGGTARLEAAGYTKIFDDGLDRTTVSAGGGMIRLLSTLANGVIDTSAQSQLIVDNGIGTAGALDITASLGAVNLRSLLNPDVAAGTSRSASFKLDTGLSSFSLSDFVANFGNRFQGDLVIRSAVADLTLGAGQVLRADSVSLTADGGQVRIAGTIDTSGDDVQNLALTDPAYKNARIDGGAIGLFGREGVSLTSTGALVSTTLGYGAGDTRQAKGGDVTIGIGFAQDPANTAIIDIAAGARIDVSALRSGDRRVDGIAVDPKTGLETTVYSLGQGDVGGTVAFRAPVLADNRVGFANAGSIVGAGELQFEGYRRFDLDEIAASNIYSGLTLGDDGTKFISIDAGAPETNKANFLADAAQGTIPDFIQNFDISTTSGSSLAGYRVRPGVELASTREIRFTNGWNLGAGQIVNADEAERQGLIKVSPLGPYTSGPLAGQKRYEVVAGAEERLFTDFVDMTYRVNGSVRGEAPIVTVRSTGTVDISHSISDGFFTFHDLTNADFIDYQLGGGNRTYNPAIRISCGAGEAAACSGDTILFADGPTGPIAAPAGTRITINIGTAIQGQESSASFINSPYNPLANSAAPSGTGDPFGVAELFPRLTDGSAVHSSDLRIVGGAQLDSVNPLQVDYNQTGSVKVSGESSYTIAAKRGTSDTKGHLQLGFNLPGAPTDFFDVDQLLDAINNGTSDEFDNPDYYTVLNWGTSTTGASAAARDAALNYAPFQANGHFLGPADPSRSTGIAARLADVIAFFRDSGFGDIYANGVSNNLPGFPSTNSVPAVGRLLQPTAYVGTVVRTGDGRIDVAAAGDIDLRRTQAIVTRRENVPQSTVAFQVGGNAIYTAGVRAAESSLRGANSPEFSGYSERYISGATSSVLLAPVIAENGGDVTLNAGGDVIGRRDVWGQMAGLKGSDIAPGPQDPRGIGNNTAATIGGFSGFGTNFGDQAWRYGIAGFDNVQVAIAPNLFTSGVGALSGGDVTIRAGRDVNDLTVALDNSLVTSLAGGDKTLITLGGGNLSVQAGRNLAGGQFDIASGVASIRVGGDVVDAGSYAIGGTSSFADNRNLLRLRVSDATVSLQANGSVAIGGIGALYAATDAGGRDGAEFFSPIAGADIQANGAVDLVENRYELYYRDRNNNLLGTTLPPSLALTSLFDDISIGGITTGAADSSGVASLFRTSSILAPSRYGQLSLLAGGNIDNLSLAMSDATPRNYFGQSATATITFPRALVSSSDAELRAQHDRRGLHLDDDLPVRIVANGSINRAVLSLPKQARIRADEDIVNLQFQGQNLHADDVTRISAGRDIFGTVGVASDTTVQGRSGVQGNNIALGGPGSLFVEAGRNLGPFVTSATGTERSEAGGIRTVGNEMNPWLASQGANIYALFGVGGGADYEALQSTYLDPANLAQLDGDLFEQQADTFGNKHPDRSKYSYAPVLAEWLLANDPQGFAEVFGATPPTGDDLKNASYANYGALYAAFSGLDQQTRNRFLIDNVYFGELAAPSDPNGNSFNQFVRGYRAVQTLFPPELGYTDNLAAYTTDPSTVNAEHPLGVPTRKLVNGEPVVADRVVTGSVDLRLSTIETARGGNISILGPGGDFVAGSVVRTEAQVSRRVTAFNVSGTKANLDESQQVRDILDGNFLAPLTARGLITSIPQGFEGVLTLRGGEIRTFTDGSFILNQSRLFTQRGGDITMWSSNGDLNAGQGPRSSSNFPPIVLRFGPNGSSEVDSAGSVSGAGIGAFKASPTDPEADIRLIAPVGTVDAGDAGVRASGSIFVAAARVANADSFAAGGTISGVPSLTTAAPIVVPAAAASAVTANAFRAASNLGESTQRASRIFVDVLGYFGGSDSSGSSDGSSGSGADCPGGKCAPQ
ncbi:MAG TPA: filamentous hemagglutinin family protein [Novosphingobium sp.]